MSHKRCNYRKANITKRYLYMVTNHQDVYPYLNLSLKVCLQKYPDTFIFFVKNIGQWILRLQGRWITRVFSLINFQRLTSTKNGYKVGTSYRTKNAGKGQEKFVLKSLSSKISGDLNLFVKNYWSMNSWTPRALDY